MRRELVVFTSDGVRLRLSVEASTLGRPKLCIRVGLGILIDAFCEDVHVVTYNSLPDFAFVEMPGCCISIDPEFLGDVEALLDEAEARAIESAFLLKSS